MAWPSTGARTKNWGNEVLTDSDLEGQFDLIWTYINALLDSSTGHDHDGTTGNSQKIPINSGLVIASQAQGDIIYRDTSSWARLGAGTAGQFLQTQGASANPQWASAGTLINSRIGMYCMQASTTTMTIAPGSVEINSSIISKTSNTTLTITTAGNWIGGSSQQATSTLAYICIDSSGNIKMTTTAPTHSDYALSITAANNTKRYASVSGTTYRYIGWFYMNATGSGELDAFGVSNFADGAVKNVVEFETGASSTGTTVIPDDDSIPQNSEGDQYMSQVFRPTNVNSKILITVNLFGSASAGNINAVALFQDSTANAIAAGYTINYAGATYMTPIYFAHYMKAATISLITFKVRAGCVSSGTFTFNGNSGSRKFGGVLASFIRVEEIEAQLT